MNITTVANTTIDITPARLDWLLSAHESVAPLDRTCIAYLCNDCGSIGMTPDALSAENLRADVDLTCCAAETTLLP